MFSKEEVANSLDCIHVLVPSNGININKKLYTAWTRGVFYPLQYWFPSVLSAFTDKHKIMTEK